MAITKTGYKNGSDILVAIDGGAIGHCTTNTITYSTDTKDRAVKPVATADLSSGLWTEKSISGLSVSISCQGLRFYQETESGFKVVLPKWSTGSTVEVTCFERGNTTTPYLTGTFIVKSLEETNAANDDAQYTCELENSGEVTFDTAGITEEESTTTTTNTDA